MQRWVVNICPFLHFDNSRTQTYEHNISIVSWNVKSVLDYLEVDSTHKFCLDQVTLLEGFERLFPNYWDSLHQRVLEGRIEIVGGTYVMPDLIIPDGESIVRQFLYGMKYFREKLGIDVRTGWAIDSAGHCSQMPQILRQCGIDSYFFWRGMLFDSPTEFVWKGPDGSRVNAVWLSEGFDSAAWLSENTREAFSKLLEIVDITGNRAASGNIFVPVGGELVPPLPHLTDITTRWNRTFPDTKMVIVTPQEFTDKIKSVQSDLPTLSGSLDSGRFSGVRSGGLSSRIKLKQMNREMESLLYLVELFLSQAGIHDRNTELENTWKILLFNQDHNLIRGTCADQPYQLAVRRFKQGIENADRMLKYALSEVTSKITKIGIEPSFVVYNPLPWLRTDISEIILDLSTIESQFFEIHDPEGNSIPYQFESVEDSPEVKILFMAENVPSLGNKVYRVISTEKAPEFDSSLRVGKHWIETSSLVLELDEFSGAVSRIFDKLNRFEVLDSAANYITFENEVGDLYRHADSELSTRDSTLTSLRSTAKIEILESGPVRSIFKVTGEMDSSTRNHTITVYEGSARIEFTTELSFKGRAKRVRLNFPLTVYNENILVGAQFANEERRVIPSKSTDWVDPENGSIAALDWVECMGSESGVCFSAPGLHEYEFTDGHLKVTLLRSVDHVSRGLDDEVIETKTARETGTHTYRYMLQPLGLRSGKTDSWCYSAEHRLPLIAVPLTNSDNSIPSGVSFLSFDDSKLALSCLKPTDTPGEYIIRVYDIIGESGTVSVRFQKPIRSIKLVDLCEKDIGDLRFENDTAYLPVDAHSIITIRVQLVD